MVGKLKKREGIMDDNTIIFLVLIFGFVIVPLWILLMRVEIVRE